MAKATKKVATARFKMSSRMKALLPESERDIAHDHLWEKSSGRCALCGEPLNDKPEFNVADHRVPMNQDPSGTTLSNLYLAHLSCNASRQDLAFDVARPIVNFKVFAENKGAVSFDHVLDRYLPTHGQPIGIIDHGDRVVIQFAGSEITAPVSTDPATQTRYFYCEAPFTHIHNDPEIQPRVISYAHVRKLAVDFTERPVHEPSNCRLILHGTEAGTLKQFDGQHKSTAQILLGRNTGSFKVYINPDIAMLQKLVIKIQQEIKKQPLTRSETLAKLGDVIGKLFDEYQDDPRTESGFIEAQPRQARTDTKKLYFGELKKLVFFDEDNDLAKYATGKSGVTTDAIVIDRIIDPLIHKVTMNIDIDANPIRDVERSNILLVLNRIRSNMLPEGWASDPLQKTRSETFFLGGAISWWMGQLLIPALRYMLYRINQTDPLLVDQLDEGAESKIVNCIDKLCAWDIWSTKDDGVLAAFRSNTVANVVNALPGYTAERLIKEAL